LAQLTVFESKNGYAFYYLAYRYDDEEELRREDRTNMIILLPLTWAGIIAYFICCAIFGD
jgi:hypothetical protein